jgi:GGDEF domain-containing protein
MATTIGYVSVVANMGGKPGRLCPQRSDGPRRSSPWCSALRRASRSCSISAASGRFPRLTKRIQFLANHDALTHLLNRRCMQEETDRVMTTARATRERVAYLYIDLDELSEVNNSFGQSSGDELLRVVAARLSAAVNDGDLVARIGADDFAVLHRRYDRRRGDRELRAAHCRCGLRTAAACGTDRPAEHFDRLCAGAAGRSASFRTRQACRDCPSPSQGGQGEKPRLLRSVDGRGNGSPSPYRGAGARGGRERTASSCSISRSSTATARSFVGFEALLRLGDAQGGYISPTLFVPIAETRGYIKAIGSWVIREAARQVAQWPEPLFVSVNLSSRAVSRRRSPRHRRRSALDDAGIEGRRLEIEVVESLLLERSEDVLDQLGHLKALGVSVDMDDFGTGYSSLSYLWRFPFDKLKIDQSFMVALTNGAAERAAESWRPSSRWPTT